MDNAVKMLMAKTGRNFRLKRKNETKVELETLDEKNEEEGSRRRNRWSCVSIKCCHGGKPRKRRKVKDASARRNSKSRKVSTVVSLSAWSGCNFHLGLWWASNSATRQENLCLAHHTPTSGGKEHERPRAFDNGNGVSAQDMEEESDLVRRPHFSKVATKEKHKALADIGKKLGPAGKQKVRSMTHTLDAGLTAKPPRRSTGGAASGCPGQVSPVDAPDPIALPHSGPTSMSAHEYGHDCGVAMGEESGAMFAEFTSVEAVQRMIERTPRISPEHLLEAEKRSQRLESTTSRVLTPGARRSFLVPRPTVRGRRGYGALRDRERTGGRRKG
ncbi:unnamed protein product [Ectocarpus sp. 4 AP-2014]